MRATLAANLLYFPATRLGGERVRHYLAEYRANDRLSIGQLQVKQTEALERIIYHAAKTTPFYRDAFDCRDVTFPSMHPLLDGLKPVCKEQLRDHPGHFTSERGPVRFEIKTTSGSTGHPLTVLKNRDALARERAATWRAYGWAGINVAAPQGLLWGSPHAAARRLRMTAFDFLANRKRLSMFGTTEADLAAFHAILLRFKPVYLYGYVSAMTEFIRFLSATGKQLPSSVKCLITTSEVLNDSIREFLGEATGLRVFNEYGCGEVGSIAHECERGQLHLMSDNLVLECLPAEGLSEGLGELVVTDLHNTSMPLIRYRLGDLGRLSRHSCSCGRPYPILEKIVGRAYDTLVGFSGKRYHPESILYVFEDLRSEGVLLPAFQAIQSADGHVDLCFEVGSFKLDEIKRIVAPRISSAFRGDLLPTFKTVSKLEREASGKLRVVKRKPQLDSD